MLERQGSAALALALLALAACGGEDVTSSVGTPQGECNAVETSFRDGSRDHVAPCSDVSYGMTPPVFGDHYPTWAAFQTYDYPVPLGYLVHDLEHGAVVVFYDCPDGCADEVAEVRSAIDAWPADPLCTADVVRRVILVPKPGLGARWAASAWGHSLEADCFDAALFADFYDRHVGNAPEDLCNQGQVIAETACQ
jgi:hypothetical protein